jgi:hypothetical protein
MTFLVAIFWVICWGYVAWRGLWLITEARRFLSDQPSGGIIPQEVLNALETGQSYVLRAVVIGLLVPVVFSIGYWVYRGFLGSKGP